MRPFDYERATDIAILTQLHTMFAGAARIQLP